MIERKDAKNLKEFKELLIKHMNSIEDAFYLVRNSFLVFSNSYLSMILETRANRLLKTFNLWSLMFMSHATEKTCQIR